LAGPASISTPRTAPRSRELALARTPSVPLVTKDFQRTTLKAHHRPVLRALAELDAFVEDVDGFISPASKTLRFGLIAMLFAIRWSPLLFFRFKTFEELTVEDRVHHLEALEKSKVKQLPLLVVAYKTVLTMIFYEDEGEQRAIGYPGPERKRWKKGPSLPVVQPNEEVAQ